MAIQEVEQIISPATFPQVLSGQTGDLAIIIRDSTTNPKFRNVPVQSLGGTIEFFLNGVSTSVRSRLNIISSDPILTDDGANQWAELTLFPGSEYLVETFDGTVPTVPSPDSFNLGEGNTITSVGTYVIGKDNVFSVEGKVFGNSNTIDGSALIFGDTNQVDSLAGGSVLIGNNLTATGASSFSVNVGSNNDIAGSDNCFIAGRSSTIAANADGSSVIGNLGNIGTAAFNSCQINVGTNNDGQTLQFLGTKVANNIGSELTGTTGDPNGSVTARQRTLLVDDNTGTDVYINTDGSMAWSLISGGGIGGYTASSTTSGTDVTLTPGSSDNRNFIAPTVASINCILLTASATNTTYWEIINDDPATGVIDVKIDLAGNPTQVTLNNTFPSIKVAYDGSFYKFYT